MIGTAIQVQKALGSIGKSPYDEIQDVVKGEETDSLVTGFATPLLFLIALGGIASGGMYFMPILVFVSVVCTEI